MLGLTAIMAHPVIASTTLILTGIAAAITLFGGWGKVISTVSRFIRQGIGSSMALFTLFHKSVSIIINDLTTSLFAFGRALKKLFSGDFSGALDELDKGLRGTGTVFVDLIAAGEEYRATMAELAKPEIVNAPQKTAGAGGGGGGSGGVDAAPARPNVGIFHDEDADIVDLEIADTELVDQPLVSVPRTIEEIDASFEGFGDKFGNIAADMAMGINNFGDAFQNVAKQILRDIIAVIAKAIIMQAVMSFIPGGAKISLGSRLIGGFGKLLGLADGGIVTGPTMAMIGEGSESEAVLPLSRLSQLIDSPSSGGPREAVFVVDGRELARGVLPHMPGEMNRMGVRRGV
jgi:hypothetical protein